MKKKIILISVVLIGFVLAVSANSWAQRERVGERHRDRGGRFEKWDKPAPHKFQRDRGRAHHPKRYHKNYRPVHRFKPKFHRRLHHGRPHPKWHRYRHWRHHRRPVIHNYYSSVERYAWPEDEFQASATVTESGFAVSVGVSKTN